MALSIRDPNVEKLARKLAASRGTNMTRAIAAALEEALENEHKKIPLADKLKPLIDDFIAKHPVIRPPLTKEEMDEMWGQ
jgi:antitoxin VapB